MHARLIIFGVVLALLIVEGILRLCGERASVRSVPYNPLQFKFRPPFSENSLTGWQLKPGSYQLVLGGREKASHILVNPDESRATRDKAKAASSTALKVVFIGDSFTFGEGLDDYETLPWRLQGHLPNTNVINHAVGGYGTCQARFRLEQLKNLLSPGDIVIYGFSSFHEERNTADPRQDYWTAITSPNHQSGYPRCSLINNQVFREDSRTWETIIPFAEGLVLSKIFTNAWLTLLSARTMAIQRELTYSLIGEMKELLAKRGASLLVLLQDLSPDAAIDYRNFLNHSDIRFVDGTEIARREDFKLPDGHPGPKMTELWAKEFLPLLPGT